MAMRLEKLLGTSAEKLAADAAGGGTVGSAQGPERFATIKRLPAVAAT